MSEAWFNYRTDDFDLLEGLPAENTVTDYIPQHPSAQNLFRVLRAQGKSALEAMEQILLATIPRGQR